MLENMKKLVLAEKPSVAREIARVMGCPLRGKGYLEGPDYVVTWALGHLVELAPPADYDEAWKRWSMGSLPMLPDPLKQVVIEESKEQFQVVKGLFSRDDISGLVIATDAGREGELVARWIMKMAGYKGEAERLWISSQTDQAIREGFATLKPASLYENLYHAAESRAAADWYVGMNVTRALTCHYDAKLSAGRVQTPTLALMTQREDERDAFTGTFYYTLKADFLTFGATWQDADGNSHITSEEKLKQLTDSLVGREGKVVSVEKVHMSEKPPLAYDLTALQQDANIYLGFSAKQTLDTLQKLYEVYKIATYPRTDSRYITHDVVATLPDRLRALGDTPFGPRAASYAAGGFRVDEERFVKDMGVTDHHAIIPTEQHVDLSALKPDEKALWQLIAIRFLEVLSPDYEYDTTTVRIQVGDEFFQSRLSAPTRQGWKEIAKSAGRQDPFAGLDDLEVGISSLKEGDTVKVTKVRSRRYATPAPERYTDATLLSAMEHAGRFVDDAATTNPNAFITKMEIVPGGVDVYLSMIALGRELTKELGDIYCAETDESSKLVGQTRDGQDMYRVSYLVRLPEFHLGDVVRYGKKYYILTRVSNSGGKIKSLNNFADMTVRRPNMPELKVYAKSTELETADVISQSSGEIQVMDPTNYSVKDILVPRDAVIGDTVKVVRIDGILYYVPQ